ncbi:MAG: metallophosphoesterase [Anaerolineales bacterium]
MKRALSRRDFLKLLKIASLQMMVWAMGADLVLNEFDADELDVKKINLTLPRLPGAFSGFRLVQISDIHIGGWTTAEKLAQVIEKVLAQQPDLVAITGDFAFAAAGGYSTSADELDAMTDQLRRLAGACPTAAVMGNHDIRYGRASIQSALELAGLIDLNNKVHALHRGGASLYLCGVDDVIYKRNRLDLVLDSLPQAVCAILLAHEPDYADTSAASGRFDLQISGHSHGGQVNLPLVGPPVLPRLGRKYPSGLYRVGEMYQYTNRGIGMTPPFVRFNCPPEMTIFHLHSPA